MKRISIAFALLCCACATEPEPVTWGLASLIPGDPRQIAAPDTVRVGVAFETTVTYYGSGTSDCNYPDGTTVSYVADVVRIQVFSKRPLSTTICTDDLRPYPQVVSTAISSAGVYRIRLVGRGIATATDSVERSVVVIP